MIRSGLEPPPSKETTLFWFVVNLLALVALGVGALGWLLFYTEYFEVIGGLLGLGGAFAWVAFTANLISEARKNSIREAFDQYVLGQPITTIVVLAIGVTFALLGPARHASLLLESTAASSHHVIKVFEIDRLGERLEPGLIDELLIPGGKVKYPLTVGLYTTAIFRDKVEGLPTADQELHWGDRERIRIPEFFDRRTLLLVRPHYLDTAQLQGLDTTLTVLAGTRQLGQLPKYRGEAVWIGATRDVPLGPAQELSWETSLKHIESPERAVFMARWLPPESIAPGYTLTTGDEITLVIREMSNELSRTVIKIRATRSGERVQDELLNRLERAHD
ncbi:MAG: hypothetical protein O7F71_16450 [Gammaproteobacteria bacterium]|nr:hypothetical protein [Gammaproteobacteria bacterium]